MNPETLKLLNTMPKGMKYPQEMMHLWEENLARCGYSRTKWTSHDDMRGLKTLFSQQSGRGTLQTLQTPNAAANAFEWNLG